MQKLFGSSKARLCWIGCIDRSFQAGEQLGLAPSPGLQIGPRKKREIGKLVFYLVTFIIAIYK